MSLFRLTLLGLVAGAVWAMTWLAAAEHPTSATAPPVSPAAPHTIVLRGADAESRRTSLVRLAAVRVPEGWQARVPSPPLLPPLVTCRYLPAPPSGTSPKFECALDSGDLVKVKYGRNPEIHAEAAATLLLEKLGYPSDRVDIVPRVRCYGCPRSPFLVVRVRSLLGQLPRDADSGYTDFEWAAVERRFPAPSIETDASEGWAWWELTPSSAPRREVDALRLLAVFLAHWDNKAPNQRLVCADDETSAGSDCDHPVAMMQDLGATFGPTKVNLGRWRELPVWADRRTCAVSMEALPWHGGTFPDAHIGEEARLGLARQLQAVSDAELRDLFGAARFAQFQSGTDDGRDRDAWIAAFRDRTRQIAQAGPCR